MVTVSEKEYVWELLGKIPDPDIPVLSIVELGLIREVEIVSNKEVNIILTPSYSGCPAMTVFKEDITAALEMHGFSKVNLKISLSPAWTTDWLSEEARRKLKNYGIAPPENENNREMLFTRQVNVTCPRCSNNETEMISRFSSTPCKALWYCNRCEQPFEYFKCH